MYIGRDTTGIMIFNDLYFILIVFFGAIILVNLIIAVIFSKFHEAIEKKEKDYLIIMSGAIDYRP